MKTLLLLISPFLFLGTPIEKKNFKIDAPVIKREIRKHKGTNEYEVVVMIKKGALNGFASYKETLPENLNATVNSSNYGDANFSFKNGVVKFLWTALPGSKELIFSYILTTDEKFDRNFPGVFKYVDDNIVAAATLKSENVSYKEVP